MVHRLHSYIGATITAFTLDGQVGCRGAPKWRLLPCLLLALVFGIIIRTTATEFALDLHFGRCDNLQIGAATAKEHSRLAILRRDGPLPDVEIDVGAPTAHFRRLPREAVLSLLVHIGAAARSALPPKGRPNLLLRVHRTGLPVNDGLEYGLLLHHHLLWLLLLVYGLGDLDHRLRGWRVRLGDGVR